VQFDVLWNDKTIVSFMNHYVMPTGFDAVPFEGDAMGAAVSASGGDPLTLQITVLASDGSGPAFIPNADGPHTHGRIPSLTLP
jgi:hypothetical protein